MEKNQIPKTIKFQAIKEEILKNLNDRKNLLKIDEDVELVDGFVNQSLTMELSNSFYIGGATVPMIMLVGKASGRIYFFALRKIWENDNA